MDESSLRPVNLNRQIRQHLASLRAAGVEWLPRPKAPLPSPAGVLPDSSFAASGSNNKNRFASNSQNAPEAPVADSLFRESRTPVGSLEERKKELTVLADSIKGCTRCAELLSTRTQTVFGVGKIDPELCFIGEAPGADEDAQGEPFVGAAGQLLNRIIVACGMKREEVYICNILKCRPPGNRTPLPNEAANCRDYLERQLALINPKYICALGACAAQNLLQTKEFIGRLRGRFHDFKGIPVLCTYHPAYLLRSPDKKKDVWEDMKFLLAKMGRTAPGK